MPLTPGDKLGPYEILAPLGAGGMGEVYKARDTRLDRTVAIKVLPDHIAQRDDLRARFEREARAVASLNHPNICTLHDIGPGYMVMELIEGESLAARIEKGPIPLDQSIKLAAQIADALDRAHRAGVTHRDVKPQNIMLTRDGVKVLDFGLAKSQAAPGPTEATLTNVLTTEGTIMGTPQYMAPEQFEGKEADARSDIWAFGAVLYEMVTGQKAFQGKSYSSLLGAILSADPPPMSVQPFTPRWLERLVKRCLEKDADDRYQNMRDIVLDLRTPPTEVVTTAPAKAGWWPWAIAGASTLALLVAGVLLYNATRPGPLRPLLRLELDFTPDTPLAKTSIASPRFAISPDGARLALTVGGADGKVRLHTRLLNQNQNAPLAGTENAHGPFFSPAGDWIGFFADGKLKKISVEGGAPITLCDAPDPRGAHWGDDGAIIASLDNRSGLSRIPSSGGTPVPVSKLTNGEATHRWPQVLPGSQVVLFTSSAQLGSGFDDASIEALSLRTGQRRTLQRGGFYARYMAPPLGAGGTGYLIYMRQSTAFAVPFDPSSLTLAGTPSPVLEEVRSFSGGMGTFEFAQNGTFVYIAGKAVPVGWLLSWFDRAGTITQQGPVADYFNPRFSPDGKRLAFSMGQRDIWIRDLDRNTQSRVSFLPRSGRPVWTPDGKVIVFRSANYEAPGLYAIRSDGSGEAKRLPKTSAQDTPNSISPDGKRLAIHTTGNDSNSDIYTIPVEIETGPGGAELRLGKRELFMGTPFAESYPVFSPDGKWLAYQSNESGTMEVYVRPFPGPGGRWQVSEKGGTLPLWSRDGRELLFLDPDQQVMAVDYRTKGSSFAAGPPRLWTASRVGGMVNTGTNHDLSPDGKRLVAIPTDREGLKPPTRLTFLLNFLDELRRKIPETK